MIDPALGTDDFRLRHCDASQFGYRCPPVEVSENEDEDDDVADDSNLNHHRDRDRNKNRDKTTGRRGIQVQLGQIQSGIAVNELNLFQFCSLLIENFNVRFHANTLKWPKRLARASPRHVPVMIAA